jgi:hypothetical protein
MIDNLVRDNRTLQKTVRMLFERLIKTERQVNQTEQNNRKNNLEIDGIPETVDSANLKSAVARILNHAATSEITENDIEAVYRIGKTSPKPTIVRMRRNLVDEVKELPNKKKLRTAPSALNFPAGVKLFINDNLSPNMRTLAFNARVMKRQKVIADTWFSNAAVRIKKHDQQIVKVTHEIDLFENFPDFKQFSFDTSLYERSDDEDDMARYDTLEGNWDNFYPDDIQTTNTGLLSPTNNSSAFHPISIGTPKPDVPPKPSDQKLSNITYRSRSLNLNSEVS